MEFNHESMFLVSQPHEYWNDPNRSVVVVQQPAQWRGCPPTGMVISYYDISGFIAAFRAG